MIIRDNAIRKVYPQTFIVNNEVDAFDVDGNKIDLDESLIAVEIEKIEVEIAQQKINQESRDYLNSTDWYVIRQQETGVAIPQDILDARQAAREAIV